MATAYLDVRLEELLRCCFVDDKKKADELLGKNRPLGTLSSRIDATYLLGHLQDDERRDLHLIRDIRNDIAHSIEPIDLSKEPFASKCRVLYASIMDPKSEPPRNCFTSAAFGLLGAIEAEIAHHVPPTKPNREKRGLPANLKSLVSQVNEHLAKLKSGSNPGSDSK